MIEKYCLNFGFSLFNFGMWPYLWKEAFAATCCKLSLQYIFMLHIVLC